MRRIKTKTRNSRMSNSSICKLIAILPAATGLIAGTKYQYRICFYFIVLAAVVSSCNNSGMRGSVAGQTVKPNILFIMADDMGYGDLSVLNDESGIKTPVLDRLLEQGRNFTEAHTSASLCSPTRYALLTGRYSFRTGHTGVASGYSEPWIEYDRETLASLLKKAGYTTAVIGKWHLGLEWQPEDLSKPVYTKDAFIPENLNVDYSKPVKGVNEVGFDYSFISAAGNNLAPFTFIKNGKVIQDPVEIITPQKGEGITLKTRRNGGDKAPGFEFDQTLNTLTREAVTYLQQRKINGPPFFLYLPLTAPHFPWTPDQDFEGTSNAGLYGDYVQEIDYRVGEILQVLKNKEMDKRTLVIFTADNGGVAESWFTKKYHHEMNRGRRGQKGQIWEGGVRVPFIARWNGVIEPGSSTDWPISLVDMLATFSGLTGQFFEQEYAEDSHDISSILLGKEIESRRGAMINQTGNPGALSITKDRWKLIPYGHGDSGLEPAGQGQPEGMLYNLREDPMEKHNVYDGHPQIVRELSALLEQYKETGYSRPRKNK